jgi:hypothetical protein
MFYSLPDLLEIDCMGIVCRDTYRHHRENPVKKKEEEFKNNLPFYLATFF